MPLDVLEPHENDYSKFAPVQETERIEPNEDGHSYGTMRDTKVRFTVIPYFN